jgi:hypothetical protein
MADLVIGRLVFGQDMQFFARVLFSKTLLNVAEGPPRFQGINSSKGWPVCVSKVEAPKNIL